MAAEPAFRSPDDLAPPNGYSHAVEVPAGRLVWTAGQVAIAADGSVPDGWDAQTRLVFGNVGRALAAAGAGWHGVVRLMIYVVDVAEVQTIRAVRDEHVDASRPPVSTLVRVAGLVRAELLLEVEAVAWLP